VRVVVEELSMQPLVAINHKQTCVHSRSAVNDGGVVAVSHSPALKLESENLLTFMPWRFCFSWKLGAAAKDGYVNSSSTSCGEWR